MGLHRATRGGPPHSRRGIGGSEHPRLLVLAPDLPNPHGGDGGGVTLGTLCAALAKQTPTAVVAFCRSREAAQVVGGLCGEPFPVLRPLLNDRSAAGRARHRLSNLFRWTLGQQPLVAAKFRSGEMLVTLRRAVRTFRPEAVLVEQSVMAQYLPYLDQVPVRVLTDHEAAGPIPAGLPFGSLGVRRDAGLWQRYVRRYYPLADRVQALNRPDARTVEARSGIPTTVRPPAVPVPGKPVDPAAAPPRLLFFGDYHHHPNPEAARYIAERIFPRIRREVPEAELLLAGRHGPEIIGALSTLAGVRVTGFVQDLGALLGRSRLLLAPLFSGDGSRIKVFTALAHGLPVITNARGARGIESPAPAVSRAEDPDQLAMLAASWLQDPKAAAHAGTLGRDWVARSLDPEHIAAEQIAAVDDLLRATRSTARDDSAPITQFD